MSKKSGNIYFLAILFCIGCWIYRFYTIFKIAFSGTLQDFSGYYWASRTIIEGIPNASLIVKSSFGPPTTVLGFLPFSFFSLQLSQLFITTINIFCFAYVFFVLWEKWYGHKTVFFWIFTGLLAFCFPIIFSLGMGNPIGIVTLGIYIFWINKKIWLQWVIYVFSIILKLFPLTVLPFILIEISKNKIKINKKHFSALFLSIIFITITTLILLPLDVWGIYSEYSTKIRTFTIPDPVVYNQSFSSTLARFGLYFPLFSLFYWIFCCSLGIGLIFYIVKNKKNIFRFPQSLETAILFLATALLIHPFPWQYYFAILVPFLILEMKKKFYIPFLIFILMSLDGGKLLLPGVIGEFIKSSQFLATLLFYLYLLRKPRVQS